MPQTTTGTTTTTPQPTIIATTTTPQTTTRATTTTPEPTTIATTTTPQPTTRATTTTPQPTTRATTTTPQTTTRATTTRATTTNPPPPTTTPLAPTTPSVSSCEPVCLNGGGMNSDTCSCTCPTAYQGDECQFYKPELRAGVELFLQEHPLTNCFSLLEPLRMIVSLVVTSFCNDHFSTCCPGQGPKRSPAHLSYIIDSDVKIAEGYPISATRRAGCYIVIVAFVPSAPPLCVEGPLSGKRRRRDADVYSGKAQGRFKRQSGPDTFMSQDILLLSLTGGQAQIEEAMGTVVEIDVPVVVEVTTSPSTTASNGESSFQVFGIAMSIAGGLLALVCFILFGMCCYLIKLKQEITLVHPL